MEPLAAALLTGDCNGHHWPFHVAGQLYCGCRAHFGQPLRPHSIPAKGAQR